MKYIQLTNWLSPTEKNEKFLKKIIGYLERDNRPYKIARRLRKMALFVVPIKK